MSPVTTLRWNPVTNGGTVTFDVHKYIVMPDGTIRSDIAPSPSGMINARLADIVHRCFMVAGIVNSAGADISIDPITGADLSQVSVGGVMNLIKAAHDTLYAEQLQALAPPPTEPASLPPPEEV